MADIQTTDDAQQAQFLIQRIYAKDISLETPQTPEIFFKTWEPELDVHLDTTHAAYKEDRYEVIVHVRVTASSKDIIIFLIEVKQAGIFTIKQFSEQDQKQILDVTCPIILFPYARETVSDLIARATFPPFYLPPIDFQTLATKKAQNNQSIVPSSELVSDKAE